MAKLKNAKATIKSNLPGGKSGAYCVAKSMCNKRVGKKKVKDDDASDSKESKEASGIVSIRVMHVRLTVISERIPRNNRRNKKGEPKATSKDPSDAVVPTATPGVLRIMTRPSTAPTSTGDASTSGEKESREKEGGRGSRRGGRGRGRGRGKHVSADVVM